MFNKMLVPLDGTDLAEGILPFVSQLSKGLDMPVVLLTVIDPDSIYFPEQMILASREDGSPHGTQRMDKVEFEAKNALQKVANRLAEQGVKAEAVVAFGRAPEEIINAAERIGADLIAMSTHGRSVLGRGILGSVADKVIHTSGVPVLTITPDKAQEFHGGAAISKVMLPLDGSELSESAIPYVEELAHKMNLGIRLIRVARFVNHPPYADGYSYAGFQDIEAEIEKAAADYLDRVADRIKAKGLKVERKVLKGSPAVVLVEETQAEPLDLIVLSTHGRSGFKRWLLGSVAEALVRASGDPVLIIPPVRNS